MQLKTCVHAKLNNRYLNHVTLMDSNLSLQYFSFLGNPPLINDNPLPTNLITLAGQIVTSINNANLNNIPILTLASGDIKGDCVGSRPSQAIANFENSSVTNGESTNTWIISFYVTADYNVSGGGGGSSIDYTNILTSINNNLSALVSKNNQSEITQKLSDIFEYTLSDNSKCSTMRISAGSNVSDSDKRTMNIIMLLMKLLQTFSNTSMGWATGASFNTSILQDIRKCIKFQVPINSSNDINENLVYIKNYINQINSKLSETVSSVDVPLLKEIALAISSLASSNDNQAIKALKDTISALELKVNVDNALLVDGTQEFRMRPFGKNYIDDEDESFS